MNYLLSYYAHRMQKNSLPLSWIFFVTSKCNSRCRHCFYWKELNKKDNELTLDEIRKISSGMGRFSHLLISGGEPTLREDIADICHIFCKNNNVKRISLPTNGLDCKKTYNKIQRILLKCKDAKVGVGLPLEGLEKTNDFLRGVKGAFRAVVKTASELAKLKNKHPNLNTYITTVVSNRNYEEILHLAKYVRNLPVGSHNIVPIRGLPMDKRLKPPTASQWNRLTSCLLNSKNLVFKKENGIIQTLRNNRKLSMHKAYERTLGNKPVTPCLAGDLIGVIEPDGDVRLCELTPAIGSLRKSDYNIKKVWFSKEADSLRKKLKGCFCTHGCFLGPSRYANSYLLLKSLFGY